MLIDIFLVSVILVLFERKIVGKDNFLPFSPLFIFLASYNLLFVFADVIALFINADVLYMSKLDQEYRYKYEIFNRVFFYLFVALFFLYFFSRKNESRKAFIVQAVPFSWVVFVLLLGVLAKFLYLGAGLGFNPVSVLQRVIYPREFTYIKSGTGLINYLQGALLLLSYFLSVVHYHQAKSKKAILLIVFCGFFFFIGGAKQQLLWLAFIFIMVKIKYTDITASGLRKNLKYLIVLCGLVVLSFSIMVVRADERSLFEKLVKYQRESYYSALVLNDFKWEYEYPATAVTDTLLAPVPRFVWEEKPLLGFYNRYWRSVYESSTVSYHTSTYGFIAEAHMIFGAIAPIMYALLFFFLVRYCYEGILGKTSLLGIFSTIYLSTLFYFFLRSGITGFTLINVLFTLLVCLLLAKRVFEIK